jgi:hypothetical protein
VAHTALHASRHDDERAMLINTVVGMAWQAAAPTTPTAPVHEATTLAQELDA